MYQLAPLLNHHIFQVSCRLREADVAEAEALGFHNIEKLLRWSAELSDEAQVILLEGEPVGIWGYEGDGNSGECLIWMTGTDELTKHPKAFVKKSKEIIDDLLEDYSSLVNIVHEDNTVHIDWLKSMGATFEPSTEHSAFLEFEIRK